MKHDSTTSSDTEIRWTDKVSLDCNGNIRDFNGNIVSYRKGEENETDN